MAQKTKASIVSSKLPLKKSSKNEEDIPEAAMRDLLPLCKKLREIKDEKEDLAMKTKKLNGEEEYIEQLLTTKLTSEGLDSVRTIYGTASTSEQVVPNVKDFDAAMAFIIKHKRFDLLPKSIKSAAWRESYEAGEVIPGIEALKLDKLSFRRTPKKGEASTA